MLLCVNYVYMWVCTCECQCPWTPEERASYPSGLKLHNLVICPRWVLGTSARAVFLTAEPLLGLHRHYITNQDAAQGCFPWLGVTIVTSQSVHTHVTAFSWWSQSNTPKGTWLSLLSKNHQIHLVFTSISLACYSAHDFKCKASTSYRKQL